MDRMDTVDAGAVTADASDSGTGSIVSITDMHQILHRVKWRWYALFLMSLFICGGYFCYDNPAELETAIEKEFNIDTTTYSVLYSVYSFPNMILPLFTGLLFLRIG